MSRVLLLAPLLVGSVCAISHGLTSAEASLFKWTRKGKQTNKMNQDIGVDGSITITSSGGSWVIKSNGLPEHDSGYDGTPNSMYAQDYTYTIPKNPSLTTSDAYGTAGCLPYSPIGFTLSGVPIFSPFTASLKLDTGKIQQNTCCDPVAEEVDLVDECLGHGAPYHYHALTSCTKAVTCKVGAPGELLGVMFDGIGVFSPRDTDGTPLAKKDLDRCNGKVGKDGRYRYHITREYPHIIGCFRGTSTAPEMPTKCACDGLSGTESKLKNAAHETCPYTEHEGGPSSCKVCEMALCRTKKDKNCDANCKACKDTGACSKYCKGANPPSIVPWKQRNSKAALSNEDALYCGVARELKDLVLASTTTYQSDGIRYPTVTKRETLFSHAPPPKVLSACVCALTIIATSVTVFAF